MVRRSRRRPTTWGLTHVALTVRDAQRAFDFYQRVLGARATYRSPGWIEFQTPGAKDIVSLVEADASNRRRIGTMGGLQHLGFRLRRAADLDAVVREAVAAGGTLVDRGRFSPGHPYAYLKDLDGYILEFWYE